MANIIRHKRSDTPGATPDASDLALGELALNTADGKIFARKSDGTVVELTKPTELDGGEMVYDSLLEGLQAFWLMDNHSGSVADVSGNNRPMFVGKASESASGVQGAGVRLDHRNFLYSTYNFLGRRTVSFWIRHSAAPASPSVFLIFGFSSGGPQAHVQMNQDGTLTWQEALEDYQNSQSNTYSATSSAIPPNTWTHVVLEKTTTPQQMKIYVNGVGGAPVATVGETVMPSDYVVVGLLNNAPVDIDCVGVWGRVLTSSEIARLKEDDPAYAPNATPSAPIDPSTFINVSSSDPISSLSISVSGSAASLFPPFDADISDYGVLTNSATSGAAVSYTLTINGVATTDAGSVNKIIRVNHGPTDYYIRLLPSDIPLGTVVTPPAEGYIPGYYLTTSRRDLNFASYNIIYDENGLPFWYNQSPGFPSLNEPGNDRNTLVIGRRNGTIGPRYVFTMTKDSVQARTYNFLSTLKNGNTYGPPTIDWQQHELIQLSSPPSRRGNIFTVAFPSAPPAGSQRIADKAYGIYLQEQTPTSGQVAWDWWTADHFNQTADTQASSFFHMNAADVHPVTGDVACSMRNCSAVICIDALSKTVKWVIQGPPSTASVPLSQVADPATTAETKFLTLEGEPEVEGFQYAGPCGQHHVRWCPHVDPLTPGNEIVTVFDNQTGFFAGAPSNISPKTVTSLSQNGTLVTGVAATHGFTTGSYVQISGAAPSRFNGIFVVTSLNSSTFTYTLPEPQTESATGTITAIRAQNYFPDAGPYARGVIYEIDLNESKAIHRGSVFSSVGRSGYLGSYQIMLHPNGEYSHVVDFNGQHPQLIEHSDGGSGVDPSESPVFAMDLAGDIYRIIKVEKGFFDADYLRATAGLAITPIT